MAGSVEPGINSGCQPEYLPRLQRGPRQRGLPTVRRPSGRGRDQGRSPLDKGVEDATAA